MTLCSPGFNITSLSCCSPHRDSCMASTATLAKGCFGKVYKEKYKDTWAAVKRVPKHLITEKDLQREWKVYKKVNHPNIVKLLGDITLKNGKWVIPLEFIFGEDLETTIFKASSSKIQMTPANKGTIIVGMCEGLHHLHSKDIVHQDLKPENIMVEHQTNRAVIIDLGLAKFFQFGLNSAIDMGNEAYSAPEVLRRYNQRDQRSDVWAMGKIIAEFCARVRLYTPAVCPAKIKETLKDNEYCHAVCRMVESDPSLRASMGGVISDIRRAGGAGVNSNPPIQKDHLQPPPSRSNARSRSPSPLNRNQSPIKRDASPKRNPQSPLNWDPAPLNKDPPPLNREATPFNRAAVAINKITEALNREKRPLNGPPAPINRDPAPPNKVVSPVNRDPAPLNWAPAPPNKVVSPVNRDPTPLNKDPPPLNREATPLNRAAVAINKITEALNREKRPLNRDPVPLNRAAVPIHRAPVPLNRAPVPINRAPVPLNRAPVPLNRAPVLINRAPVPLNRAPVPINRAPVPLNRAEMPLNRDPVVNPDFKALYEDQNKNQTADTAGRSDLAQDFMKMRFYQEATKNLPLNLPTTGRVVVQRFEEKNGEVELWEQKEVVTRDGKIVKFDDVRFNCK
uniref:non-specific serine/threonine protein kinase n=1 Tax=Echeneis naucrates TaxID=173247 RepID=A0A665UWA1_ECHNA